MYQPRDYKNPTKPNDDVLPKSLGNTVLSYSRRPKKIIRQQNERIHPVRPRQSKKATKKMGGKTVKAILQPNTRGTKPNNLKGTQAQHTDGARNESNRPHQTT